MSSPAPGSAACEECGTQDSNASWRAALWTCAKCGALNGMPSRDRLLLIADVNSLGPELSTPVGGDPLGFVDQRAYPDRLKDARAETGEDEAFIAAPAIIGGVPSVIGAFDFAFIGGTMSVAVGERIACVFELAAEQRRAVVLCTASGGARMQEGTLALFQMIKTVAALARFRKARKPFVAVLGNPTLGGVAASFATRADVILAEPRARIGFAGPRVIEQLLGGPLPDGFQRAEYLLEHGFIDRVVERARLHDELVKLIRLLSSGLAFSG